VQLGSWFRRLAFAARFANFDTLISSRLEADSQVLMVRNIRERIVKLAPGFLYPDADPYLVVLDGKLEWVVDLYTITSQYPYSTDAPTGRLDAISPGLPNGFNYIRNSVKATVSAFDGEVTFYVVDDTDPLIQAYQDIFPTLFTPGSEMPADLVEHLRYPEDMFRLQSDMYTIYHMTDPTQFFSSVDPWVIALDPSTSERTVNFRSRVLNDAPANEKPMLPYYLLMKLPEDQEDIDPSFIIMQPFTPRGRPNMVSFMVAKSGPEDYGQIIDFRLPSGTLQQGPRQVGADQPEPGDFGAVHAPRPGRLANRAGQHAHCADPRLAPVRSADLHNRPECECRSGQPGADHRRPTGCRGPDGHSRVQASRRLIQRQHPDEAVARGSLGCDLRRRR
jgi:hypothetical protein